MSYTQQQQVLEHLKELGEVSSKTVFGVPGFFQSGVMFGLLGKDGFYLRGSGVLTQEFDRLGMVKWEAVRRGRGLKLHYYRIEPELWNNPFLFLNYARQAIQYASTERTQELQELSARYADSVDKYLVLPVPPCVDAISGIFDLK